MASTRTAAAVAAGFWIVNVLVHHQGQELFAWLADTYGFATLQAVEAWIFILLFLVFGAWLGLRRGWRIAGIVMFANLLGAATFVTRAEALHLVQYALVCVLWARAVKPRQAFYLTVMLGVCDEVLQWAWLDTARSASFVDLKDCGLNLVGALNGWALSWAFSKPQPKADPAQ